MARRIAAVLITLGCLQSSAVSALGLGELTLDSFLNEPFKASVDLLNTGGLSEHQVRIRLATLEDFDRLGVERGYFLSSITFEIEIDENGHGRILMTSHDPVLEPFLDFIVEARWPTGRLLREYTVLIDPPVFDQAAIVTISASQKVQEIEGSSSLKKKAQATTNSEAGTTVKVAKSDLSGGEMPRRNFGSDASLVPEAGGQYMIRRDETLWAIALKAKPEGSSVHQTMLDIQRLNPAAFIGGNINRIKAGYIIYLPDSADMSSDNVSAALDEVRQQNQDWRDGVSSGSGQAKRASLRISTEPQQSVPAATDNHSASGIGGEEELEKSERGRAEVEQRLDAMAERVDTLQHIVSLKDDQIAALQNALAEATTATSSVDQEIDSALISDLTEPLSAEETSVAETSESEPSVAVTQAPVVVAEPQVKEEESGGLLRYAMYIVGLLVAVGAAAFFFQRRRDKKEDDGGELAASDEVFADIQLEEQSLDVEVDEESVLAEPTSEQIDNVLSTPSRSRGYGERKHDQYAADMDAGDALAEADIYIAYGRFPQALDLLKTAISSEPDNASYKLKLLEVSAELGDQAEAMKQYAALTTLGDADALAKAEVIVKGLGGEVGGAASTDAPDTEFSESLNLDILDDVSGGSALDDDFGALEIEGFDTESIDDDLDLTADFSSNLEDMGADIDDGEEMVFAEDSDAMSTKLDLARAYLDMGDQNGARQIFEEVVAEGSDEQKTEARALLEQLD